jgi:hypothetical protein
MEKQNHEDKPRGICSLQELMTPIGATRLFLLRGLLGLLGRGFLFGWHSSDHLPFCLYMHQQLS